MHDFAGDRMDEDIRRPIARALKWHTPHATRGESCREGDHGQEGDGYGPCSLPHLAQRCLASASQAQVEQARALRVQAEGNVAKAEAYPEAVAWFPLEPVGTAKPGSNRGPREIIEEHR